MDRLESDEGSVELLWLPVGAETNRFQQATLRLWEALEAARARRPRVMLVHSALRLRTAAAEAYTVELTPAFQHAPVPPAATGPVGFRGADRFLLFRYHLQCLPGGTIPDEEWAIGEPAIVATGVADAQRILDLAPQVPRYTWGRRVRGTSEMWTSDSVISWLLYRSGIDLGAVSPPPATRAPGWHAGLEIARRRQR